MLRFIVSLLILTWTLLLSLPALAAGLPMPAVPDLAPLLAGLLALAGVVMAAVAGLKQLVGLSGWKTVTAIAAVSLLLCCSLVAYLTPQLWWQGLILAVLVAVLSLCGDVYLTRLLGKVTAVSKTIQVIPSDPTIIEADTKPDAKPVSPPQN